MDSERKFPRNIMEQVHTSTERDREGWKNFKELAVFEATMWTLGIGQAILWLQVATN